VLLRDKGSERLERVGVVASGGEGMLDTAAEMAAAGATGMSPDVSPAREESLSP
jgi:hypothetical protein